MGFFFLTLSYNAEKKRREMRGYRNIAFDAIKKSYTNVHRKSTTVMKKINDHPLTQSDYCYTHSSRKREKLTSFTEKNLREIKKTRSEKNETKKEGDKGLFNPS
jgi:hypothetical protein